MNKASTHIFLVNFTQTQLSVLKVKINEYNYYNVQQDYV